MPSLLKLFERPNPEIAVWVAAAIIVLIELPRLKNLLVYLFMELYEFFIQRNAEGL